MQNSWVRCRKLPWYSININTTEFCRTLIFTATDTTSGAIARLLHLLALHPHVQDRLRAEVIEAYHHQDEAIDFNNVSALPYMDAVIRETLRVYVQKC
jgi:cytochrome P450